VDYQISSLSEAIGSESRMRHIVNRINYIREMIRDGHIAVEYIPTERMVADILTGPRGRDLFERLRTYLLEGHVQGKRREPELIVCKMKFVVCTFRLRSCVNCLVNKLMYNAVGANCVPYLKCLLRI
jgi:hypothetical protein